MRVEKQRGGQGLWGSQERRWRGEGVSQEPSRQRTQPVQRPWGMCEKPQAPGCGWSRKSVLGGERGDVKVLGSRSRRAPPAS